MRVIVFTPATSYDGMHIALYGGSFNPPHIAHQFAILYALAAASPSFDRVWILPTWKHPFDKQLAPYEDRVTMCLAMAKPFGGRVEVSRLEEELGGESYTYNTVTTLGERYRKSTFAMVIGADLLAERERWHRWPELKELIDFFVVGRAGATDKFEDRPELPGISSTELRARLARGEDCSRWMDARVLAHVQARGLYREAK